jgi:uncharacterized membrane protein
MNKNLKRYILPVATSLLPLVTLAQLPPPGPGGGTTGGSTYSLLGILGSFSNLLNILITFLILLATVIFLWGIVKYILAGGDEEKVKEARSTIIYGIIFLAVMIAIWGFVNVVLDFIFGSGQGREVVPTGPQQPAGS